MKSASNADALRLIAPASKEGGEVEPSKLTRDYQENMSRETRKRKAIARHGGRSSRRRSTLSPWELESLIQGNVGKGAE
jgi:hypothetical protein